MKIPGTEIAAPSDPRTSEEIVDWLRSKGGFNPFAENLVLMMMGKPQVAHEQPFVIFGEALYLSPNSSILHVSPVSGGIVISVDGKPIKVAISDVRVYNACIQLIKAIQIHDEENEI